MQEGINQPYFVDDIPTTLRRSHRLFYTQLIEQGIELFGLENKISAPFITVQSHEDISKIVEALNLPCKIYHDESEISLFAYNALAQKVFAESLERIIRPNEIFSSYIGQGIDKDTICIALVGVKHIPKVKGDMDKTIEEGMQDRLSTVGKTRPCYVTYDYSDTEEQFDNEVTPYFPKSDTFGSYEPVESCTVIQTDLVPSNLIKNTIFQQSNKHEKNVNNSNKKCVTM
ncbi:hypothetical protein [Legionella tunisiensis]|uniref:hypothetical protein n=1 Tax=Legionella tunisiensis TaxID=1034944 RepID=UPI0002F9232E|nr:hypothetical protein [Legionella tunisiensis]